MKKMSLRFGAPLFAVMLMMAGAPGLSQAFTLNGFSDVTYTTTENDGNGQSNNGFNLGQLDFYVAEQISDRIDVLAEFVIESPGDGFVIDLERLQVGYALNNTNKVRAGRFHNLLGYWNLAFHHGAHLSTSIGRPFFLEFEDDNGVIPTHMVGLWWASRVDTGAGRIDFGLMAGNGASLTGDGSGDSVELNPDSGGDQDNEKAVSANLTFRPKAVRGLEVGISGQFGTIIVGNDGSSGTTIQPGGVTVTEIEQTLYGVHAAYQANNLELLAEYYAWNHDTTPAMTFDDSDAFYVQAGYLVGGNTTPYVRYESLDVAANDPYFQAVGMTDAAGTARTKTVTVVGVRYDLNYRSALKVEIRSIDDDYATDTFNEGAVQWTFAF
jgi:hypothetical protein